MPWDGDCHHRGLMDAKNTSNDPIFEPSWIDYEHCKKSMISADGKNSFVNFRVFPIMQAKQIKTFLLKKLYEKIWFNNYSNFCPYDVFFGRNSQGITSYQTE